MCQGPAVEARPWFFYHTRHGHCCRHWSDDTDELTVRGSRRPKGVLQHF